MSLPHTTRIARRIFKKYRGNGFTSTEAFVESRLPQTGHSVDVLWDGDIKNTKKLVILQECSKICLKENHDVAGWEIAEKRKLLNPPSLTPISDVVASPNEVNDRHGSIILRNALQLALDDKHRDNKFLVQMAAKSLKEIFLSQGEGFVANDPSWHVAAAAAELASNTTAIVPKLCS